MNCFCHELQSSIKLLKSGFKGWKKVAIELNRLGVPQETTTMEVGERTAGL